MRILASAVALLTGLGLIATAQAVPTGDVQPRIIAGQTITDEAQNPGAVFITYPGHPIVCSGSRLGPTWVLTARHCLGIGELSTWQVYTHSVQGPVGVYAKVKKSSYPPEGDVALLELDSAPPGKVMGYSSQLGVIGEKYRVFGWGKTSDDSGPSPYLKTTTMQMTRYTTNPYYDGPDYTLKWVDGAPFWGDSGGPLVDAQGRAIGTVSGGGAVAPQPGASKWFAQLHPLLEWIQTTTHVAPDQAPYFHAR